ncbi:hypothetical protein [Methanolobus sp. WCC4]|uniref:DUF7847 domain-containing protein n=1 Tax=Methanolobus sp. WCC4 TaxID=3125784 RepID=UPI0030F939D9
MVEDIGAVISKGFGTWKRNLNICVPFILELVTVILFFILGILIFTLIFIMPLVSQQNIDPESLSPDEMLSLFSSVFSESMFLMIVVGLVLLLLYMVFSSFFTAGAIGMAKKALETGHTDLHDMFRAGSENFLNLFLTNVLISLLTIAGLVFLVPGIISIGDVSLFLSNPESEAAGATLLVLGMLAWVFYIIALSIVLFFVNYALVVDNLDPISAIETGLAFFRHNILSAIFMWLFIIGVTVFISVIGEVASYVDVIAQLWSFAELILSTIVIQPLITVWLTRFYLDRTEKKLYSFEEYMLDY